jgi:hypothetical protein
VKESGTRNQDSVLGQESALTPYLDFDLASQGCPELIPALRLSLKSRAYVEGRFLTPDSYRDRGLGIKIAAFVLRPATVDAHEVTR